MVIIDSIDVIHDRYLSLQQKKKDSKNGVFFLLICGKRKKKEGFLSTTLNHCLLAGDS